MLTLLTAAFLSTSLAATPDTLTLERALMSSAHGTLAVYQTDSLNMKGEKYDEKSVLNDNKQLALRADLNAATPFAAMARIEPKDNRPTIYTLHFAIDARKFAPAKLNIASPASYKLFVNEVETSDLDLKLAPGRTRVALTCLVMPGKADSLNIKLTGKELDGVQLVQVGKEEKPHLYTMADMMLGEHYRSANLSPSGKYLVTGYYNTKADGKTIYRTVVSETETMRTVLRRGEYMDLRWMPRRDVMYFTRHGEEGRELVTLDPATGEEKLIAIQIPEGGFTMSPAEDYLIYSKTDEGKKETNGLKKLQQPDDRMGGWRNRNALYRYDLKTGTYERLSFGASSVYLSDISLDGKQLLLTHSTFDANRKPFSRTSIVRMDAYTGKAETLIADTAWIGGVRFSPDGTQLLVKATPAAFGGIGSEVKKGQTPQGFDYRLFLYDIATRKTTFLLPGFKPSVGTPRWHAIDGNIYFTADESCNQTLYRLDPKTKKVERYNLPVSYIQGFTLASNAKNPEAVVYGQTGERARDMYRFSLAKTTPKVTRIGEIDFDEIKKNLLYGTVYDWSFKASRGDSIQGFYVLPPGFDASKKYPVIVYYYGGCTPTQKMLEFQYPLQVLAAQGYVVYVVQPSGAIGFGQEFAARHVNTWGKESGDDIIEGTKAFLKAHAWANADKVGCMGASYGGFMTQYLQTRTDIFAAAISHAGISNIASYWGGGYWGYTYGEVAQYQSYPWNNPELYTKQSPLFNADKIHTPLLLLHGTADTNVPTNESQQLYTALRILGREVSYIQVDGENHVIVDYRKRLAWQNAIFAWFAKHLKDEPVWWETLYPEK